MKRFVLKTGFSRFVILLMLGTCLHTIIKAQYRLPEWPAGQNPAQLVPAQLMPSLQDQTSTLSQESRETFNVRLLGARGNGRTDDTAAIRAAVQLIAQAGGGRLYFPNGVYPISGSIDLPSGITIEGTNGSYSGNCKLLLTKPNQAVFTIGENRRRISISNIELKANPLSAPPYVMSKSTGVSARGSAPNSSFEIEFRNMTFTGFDRGISVEDSQNQGAWQFDNVLVDHCTFAESTYGIYLDTQNADYWKINNCWFSNLPGGYGIYLRQSGFVTIDTTHGGGPPAAKARGIKMGSTFIYVGGAHGTLTIINAQSEEVDNFMEVVGPSNYTYPITVINSIIGPNVKLRANCVYVSLGNTYITGTVQTVDQGTDVLIHSIGDVAVNPANTLDTPKNASPFKLQANSRVVIGTNIHRVDFGNPTTFGRGVGIGADPVADALLNLSTPIDNAVQLRLGSPQGFYYDFFRDTTGYLNFRGNQQGYVGYRFNGDIVPAVTRSGNLGTDKTRWASVNAVRVVSGDAILSDKNTGEELYRIREDQNNIYFEDIRTGKQMMRLDRDGNLHVSGKVYQDSK